MYIVFPGAGRRAAVRAAPAWAVGAAGHDGYSLTSGAAQRSTGGGISAKARATFGLKSTPFAQYGAPPRRPADGDARDGPQSAPKLDNLAEEPTSRGAAAYYDAPESPEH